MILQLSNEFMTTSLNTFSMLVQPIGFVAADWALYFSIGCVNKFTFLKPIVIKFAKNNFKGLLIQISSNCKNFVQPPRITDITVFYCFILSSHNNVTLKRIPNKRSFSKRKICPNFFYPISSKFFIHSTIGACCHYNSRDCF